MSLFKIAAEGSLKDWSRRKSAVMARYMTAAATDAAVATRDDLRGQAAGFIGRGASARRGQDPIKTIRAMTYPKTGASIGAAAIVYFKADWWEAHANGAVIRAGGARWLAIPLPGAIQMGLDRTTRDRGGGMRVSKRAAIPEGLRFIPLDGGTRALLVLDTAARYVRKRGAAERLKSGDRRQGPGVPLFLLVRSVRLPKRINRDAAAATGFSRYLASLQNVLAVTAQA